MATIAVITVNDRCCMGARQLSSLVKDRHEYNLICYGEYHHATFSDTARVGDEIDERLLLDLLRSLSPHVVGFSYRSVQAELVGRLARRIRSELGFPVLMGGIGATSDPNHAIQVGDIVCMGEGDFVLPQLLDAIDREGSLETAVRGTSNLWYKVESGLSKNPLARLVSAEELSEFPYIDYGGTNKFSIVRGRLIENDGRFDNDVGAYPMLTSRGCPFACTFCHNSNVHELYRGQRYCRQRSVDSVVRELEYAKSIPATKVISIYDDLFTFNREWALEFAAEYKRRITLPFWCYTHPAKVSKEVMEALVDAGLDSTAMGVQSGSERVLYDVYNRKTSRSKILEAAAVLKDLKCWVQIDLITANPFETDDDRRDTLDLMLAMPKNSQVSDHGRAWRYSQSRLTYFPNSRISQMVEERGIDTHVDPDFASFWEMLHELTLLDYLPPSAVMYLSYLYDEFKATAKDFKLETGAEWIWMRLLDRPLEEISKIMGPGTEPGEIERTLGWVPAVEELSVAEVRILMDAVVALESDQDAVEVGRKVMFARNLLRRLTPEHRTQHVKEGLRSIATLVVKLAADIQNRAEERVNLWKEVEARGKWALERDRAVRERDGVIRDLKAQLDEKGQWALDLAARIQEKDGAIRRLQDATGMPPA